MNLEKNIESKALSIAERDLIASVIRGKRSNNFKKSLHDGIKTFKNRMLIRQLFDYCDKYFKKCDDCNKKCSHPSGKCSGSCADCLKEIQYHRTNGRTEYDCKNMLRYYTCHTIYKRCSEVMYALETLDLKKYPNFNILSIGCGSAPDLMAFLQIVDNKKVSYHGIDIEPKWESIHNYITSKAHDNIGVSFAKQDIYELLEKQTAETSTYNILILQYMIAGHIHSDRADKIDLLFDEIINKLIVNKSRKSPLLLIINDIDHKSWICDYFNLFTKKLRKYLSRCSVIISDANLLVRDL